MLTHNDLTVPNATELFEECKDLPVKHWGFKDVGLSDEEIIKLGKLMKEAGKTTYLEIVTCTEEAYKRCARLGIEGEFDNVTCGHFNQELADTMRAHSKGYMPSNGILVHDPLPDGPVVMISTKEELIENSKYGLEHGATGFDFVAYRSNKYDGDELIPWMRMELPDIYLAAAGGVISKERIKFVCENNYDAFTTGSALFNGVYAPGGSFYDNLKACKEYLDSLF